MNNLRQITDDELLIVLKTLLAELDKQAKDGKHVFFPPQSFALPKEDIANFSYATRETNLGASEALHLLGATLYHLSSGCSEYSHEHVILDGYAPLGSRLWPAIVLLLQGRMPDLDKIIAQEMPEIPEKAKSPEPVPENETVQDAINPVLTGLRILSHNDVASVWNVPVAPNAFPIRYTTETWMDAIEANKNGEQWICGYYSGQNLREMRQKIGTDPDSQPCFKNTDWWLRHEEDYWADKKELKPGYYLLNYNGEFKNELPEQQEEHIAGLGAKYAKCHEFIVTEIALSNFFINGQERLLEIWYHCGKELGSNGKLISVGGFKQSGFHVGSVNGWDKGSNLRVVILRKHDF